MKALVLALCLVTTSAYPASDPSLRQAFKAGVASSPGLDAFRTACRPGVSLDFDGDSELLPMLDGAKNTATLAARAGLVALAHCTDGASALALRCHLGNEFLLAHPAALSEALAAENTPDGRYGALVESEPKDFFAVECTDADCKVKRKAAFAKKRRALQKASVKGPAKEARDKLLKALISDR